MSVPNIHHVNWGVVQAMVGSDIPYSELPTDRRTYTMETGRHLHPNCMPAQFVVTAGVIRFIDRPRFMKKEAEFKTALERLENQQKDSNDKYDQLLDQYQRLLASYTAMKNAYDAEHKTVKALKKQLNTTLKILKSLE